MGRLAALAAAIAVVATGCTLGPGNTQGTSGLDDAQGGLPLVTAIEGLAEVSNEYGDPRPYSDAMPTGDDFTVEGFGDGAVIELAWPDGSYTRLADDTIVRINAEEPRLELLSGTIWNRVSEQGGGVYSVQTPEGVVTATGTAFVLLCISTPCEASVMDGSVSDGTTTLTSPATAPLASQAFGPASPLPWDAVFGSPFAQANSDLDDEVGFAPLAVIYSDYDPGLASLVGTLVGTQTVTDAECSGTAEACAPVMGVGDVRDREYTFDIDCSAGIPCDGVAVTEYAYAGTGGDGTEQSTVPLTFDGTTYMWEFQNPASGPICPGYADGGAYENNLYWTLTPTGAEIRDGAFVVTEATGTSLSELVVTEDPSAECAAAAGDLLFEWWNTGELDLFLDG